MASSLIQCSKGHFYNGDKFASCPHCEASKGSGEPMDKTMKMDGNEMVATVDMDKTESLYTMPDDDAANLPKGSLTEEIERARKRHAGGSLKDDISDDQKTISFFSAKSDGGSEPTVGLLLCVEGKDFGNTYLLKTGKNFVGRSNSMDVVIAGDNGVSREKHAIILYEPRSRKFIAQPGESRELFYVNEQVVLSAQELNVYDEIVLGNTKLIFIPICGERFSWDDYMQK